MQPPSSIKGVREGLVQKKFSAKELVENYLARISVQDKELHSYLFVAEESVREEAAKIDESVAEGLPLGALAGVPVAIKDNICTEGYNTECYSKILEGDGLLKIEYGFHVTMMIAGAILAFFFYTRILRQKLD